MLSQFRDGEFDHKLSEFLEEIIVCQTKKLNQKLKEINNRDIHFMSTEELIKKIDLIVFSDFN